MVFEAILEERKKYERNMRRRSREFQDLGYICCSPTGRPRSGAYFHEPFKKLLRENGLPDIRWHGLRTTYCTILLKNDFNPKVIAKLMGHSKEIITMDVYGDNSEIIEDCLTELEPFIDKVAVDTENFVGNYDAYPTSIWDELLDLEQKEQDKMREK